VQDAVQLPERTFSAKDNKPTNQLIEGATPFFGRFSGNRYVKESLTTCSSFPQQIHRVKKQTEKMGSQVRIASCLRIKLKTNAYCLTTNITSLNMYYIFSLDFIFRKSA
jgi:hypothetical protein